MKGIKKIIVNFIVGVLVGAVAMCAVFYVTEGAGSVDWQEYIEGTIIPLVLSTATAAGVGSLAFKPTMDGICSLVKAAVGKFTQATKDVNDVKLNAAEKKAEAAEKLAKVTEFAAAVADMKKELSLTRGLLEAVQSATEVQSSEVKQMLRLGFGNMDELVKKGSAKRIMKVGEIKTDAAAAEGSTLASTPNQPLCDSIPQSSGEA